jgi:acetyl-CoA carboxylase biotin carboxyl carrier protein
MSKRNQSSSSSSKARPQASAAASSQAGSGIDLSVVRELAKIAGEYNLSEVEADPTGHVRVRRQMSAPGGEIRSIATPPALSLAPPPGPAAVDSDPGTFVSSPFVGTFYRAPSPEAASFVEVGQSVRKGQVVCIVEAMKLMNEIESESDGRVAEILAQNGEHVEYGQALIRLVTVRG